MADPALASLEAPPDPRLGWEVPAFGALPVEAQLGEGLTRVLAPNASHMTLDGTNTYVVGRPGSGAAFVVDPGPDDPAHRGRVDAVLARRDAECAGVLVTHHHHDHAEAAQAWARSYGCRVAASTVEVAGPAGRVVTGGDTVSAAGLSVAVVPTPGHCSDHVAFRLPTGDLLTGDHVLGRGTSVVTWPEGDLLAYLESLERVLDLGPGAMYPGHGPELAQGEPVAVVRYYLQHRRFRERQVLAVLAEGPATPPQLVRRIYADVDERLWPAAEASTRAALAKLAAEGRLDWDGRGAGGPDAVARLVG